MGDLVRCIDDNKLVDESVDIGDILEVQGIDKVSSFIKVNSHYSDYGRFELVDNNSLTTVYKKEEDIVNKPSHYTQGKIEALSFIEDQNLPFHESQVLKYIVRARHKGNELIDLRKAQFYLNRKIKLLEEKV